LKGLAVHRINFGCYGVAINPLDGSLWCSGIGVRDQTLMRLERGPNPPQTCKAEVYVPPPDKMPLPGSGGVAIGTDGRTRRHRAAGPTRSSS
jgi:hypothetical protein